MEAAFLLYVTFFKRREYIKIEGRPVIAIYKNINAYIRVEMLRLWSEMARKEGFEKGLFIIGAHQDHCTIEYPLYADGVYDFEPFSTMADIGYDRLYNNCSYVIESKSDGNIIQYKVIDYSRFCEKMFERYIFKGTRHYLGMFTGWDNSPRVGTNVYYLFEGNTPERFCYFLSRQYEKSICLENDFLFINAWNEWGEGAILQPDEKYGYGYLEAVRAVKNCTSNG